MKHHKPYYILESRKPLSKSQYAILPNKVFHTIGLFSKPEKAVSWIKNKGQNYFSKKSKKLYFWCLCECLINIPEMVLYNFYDKNGNILSLSASMEDLKEI